MKINLSYEMNMNFRFLNKMNYEFRNAFHDIPLKALCLRLLKEMNDPYFHENIFI
jgi:hypothetical protein